MSVDKDAVRSEYEKGGYTYQKVADKFNISVNTVKSWAKRDKDEGNPWIKGNNKKVATKDKKLQLNNKVATKKEKIEKSSIEVVKDIDKEIVEEVLENNELTDKQKLFCLYYIKCFNATKAAIKSGYSKETATEIGYENLRKPHIQKEIQRLKQNKLNRAMLSADDIFQKYMDIAFADFNDYAEFGKEDISVMDHETGKQKIDLDGNPVFYERNYLYFKDSSEVDGTIITEVSQGKDGIKIKLADKMRAMQWLGDRLELLPTETKEKLKLEEKKLKLAQDKLDLEKEKVDKDKGTNIKVTIVDDIGSD